MRSAQKFPVAAGFSPRPQRSLKAATTRNAHFALLLFFVGCVGRVEKTGEFEKTLLFDATAECVPSVVSLDLESNAAALLQTAEKAGPLYMKVDAPSEEGVRAAAARPFMVVNPNAAPAHTPNEALLASRRQTTSSLPEGLLPADMVAVWDVVYPADVLTDLDAALASSQSPPSHSDGVVAAPFTGASSDEMVAAPFMGASSDAGVKPAPTPHPSRAPRRTPEPEVAAAVGLVAERSRLARSGEEKACIEDKHSALQVLQSRLNSTVSGPAADELVRRSRLALGAALQCGAGVGEDAVTCVDDTSRTGGPVAKACLHYEVQASLKETTETQSSLVAPAFRRAIPVRVNPDATKRRIGEAATIVPPAIIPSSAEVTNRVLCVRAGAEAMLQAARRGGDTLGVKCLGMVLSELESAEKYLLAGPRDEARREGPSGPPSSGAAEAAPLQESRTGELGRPIDSPNPALIRRADELAGKAESCVATPQAADEPPAGLNVALFTKGDDPNAEPISLITARVPSPTLGGPSLSAPVELASQPETQDKATPTLVKIAVAVASVPEPIVLPQELQPIPDLPPDVLLPELPPQPTFQDQVKEAVKTALDPATPPPSREETQIAANVIAQNFSAAVEEATEEAVPVDETPPQTAFGKTPLLVTRDSSAVFEFSCSDSSVGAVSLDPPSCSFECSLDGSPLPSRSVIARSLRRSNLNGEAPGLLRLPLCEAGLRCVARAARDDDSFSPCTSPLVLSLSKDGSHSFSVRATDAALNVDPSPATFTWTIDTTAPETTITNQPSPVSGFTTAAFEFSCSEPNSSPAAPVRRGGLPTPLKLLRRLDARPQAGKDVSRRGASLDAPSDSGISRRGASLDAPSDSGISRRGASLDAPSDPGISRRGASLDAPSDSGISRRGASLDAPSDPGGSEDPPLREDEQQATSDVGATSTSPACTYECSLDSADFSPCTPPYSSPSLVEGQHTFSVRATDAAGNLDDSSATYKWSIDTDVPDTALIIMSAGQPVPSGLVLNKLKASITFSCSDSSPTFIAPPRRGGLPTPLKLLRRLDARPQAGKDVSRRGASSDTPSDPGISRRGASLDTPSGSGISRRGASLDAPSDPGGSEDPPLRKNERRGMNDEPCSFECSFTITSPTESQTTDYEACEPPPSDYENDENDFGAMGEGTYTIRLRAKDAAGNVDPTPASLTWTVDKTPPETAFGKTPLLVTRDSSHVFEFSCTDPVAAPFTGASSDAGVKPAATCSFQCSLDSADFSSCVSPLVLSLSKDGPHTFSVRATDPAGNVDPTPASYEWSTDTTPPTAFIDANLPDSSAIDQSWAKFALSCSDQAAEKGVSRRGASLDAPSGSGVSRRGASLDAPSGSGGSDDPPLRGDTSHVERRGLRGDTCTYQCSLDSAAFSSCTSPIAHNSLPEGAHTFSVRATDSVGNVSKIAKHTWMAVRIDDTAPETTAEADEDMVSLDEEITFEFSCAEEVKADEASCKFKCNAADTEYIDCASPWTIKFSKLPSGSSVDGIPLAVRTHVAVKAINKDGYEDPTPADIEIVVIPTPECGNQTCELAESVQTCPQDCDTAAPDTFITSKPSSPTAVSFDKITYDCKSPNNTACTFECSQESSDYAECSPEGAFLYYLGNGPHTFAVRAKNSAGIADETPASVSWVVDMFGPTFAGLTRANKQSDGTSVLLGWAEATDNVSQPANLIYQICWSETKGQCAANFTSNYTTFAGATSHTVKGLSSTATYYFTAVAIDEAGNRSAIAQETEVKMAGGIITTVAGTTGGNSGDNGPATEARLWRPGGVAVDPNGILYIADTGNHRVRKVDPSGIITAVAGNGLPGYSGDGGKATEAWLWAPGGVAVDPNGNLYIADTDSHHIRKVDTSGNITTVAGNPSLLNGRYQGAYSGDSGKATAAKLNIPSGVAVDSNGNLYIADTGNHRIRKVDATTQKITTVAGNGLPGYSGDGGKATEASLWAPGGVAVDPNGNLYIADTDSHHIRKVDTSGNITTVAGTGTSDYSGDGGAATDAKLNFPIGVAVDSNGNLYIADTGNHRIRKVDATTQKITTVAGNPSLQMNGRYQGAYSGDSGKATAAMLNWPKDVAVDSNGDFYIADSGNFRIRKVAQ